ncbi:MAG: CDP-diacylglycerol--glycerol-3-phosphate 3-phosphatidyltransferase [Candidatus Woesearchaeota archaeon]
MIDKILRKDEEYLNLPNIITLIRFLLIPVILTTLFYYKNYTVSLIIFIIASFTDKLDGSIARKFNLVTDFGKFIDPIVDKLLIISILISFIELGIISSLPVIVIVFRELTITGFRALAASKRIIISASPLGKYKTVSQIISIIIILLFPNLIYGIYILYFSVFMTLLSGIDYLVKNKTVFKSD